MKEPYVNWSGQEPIYIHPEKETPGPVFPTPPNINGDLEWQSIFVGISSFRDTRCAVTLYSMFYTAKNPRRIFAGVLDQRLEGVDSPCLLEFCRLQHKADARRKAGLPLHRSEGYFSAGVWDEADKIPELDPSVDVMQNCRFVENVRVRSVPSVDSEGPIWARIRQQQMLGNQEFCLQVDAHSLFKKNWDVDMLNMWLETKNEFAVLTHYVHDLASYDAPNAYTPHVCKTIWGAFGVVRNDAATACNNLRRPKLNNLWCAGLSFSKCHAEKITRNPAFAGIFDGEEFSRGAQLWTHGYDFYTPSRNLIFHDYFHKLWKEKRTWNKDVSQNGERGGGKKAMHEVITEGVEAIKSFLDFPDTEPRNWGIYGFGKARSYQLYQEFAGINTRAQNKSTDKCGDLTWVPYTETPVIDPYNFPPYDWFLPMQQQSASAAAAGVDEKVGGTRSTMTALTPGGPGLMMDGSRRQRQLGRFLPVPSLPHEVGGKGWMRVLKGWKVAAVQASSSSTEEANIVWRRGGEGDIVHRLSRPSPWLKSVAEKLQIALPDGTAAEEEEEEAEKALARWSEGIYAHHEHTASALLATTSSSTMNSSSRGLAAGSGQLQNLREYVARNVGIATSTTNCVLFPCLLLGLWLLYLLYRAFARQRPTPGSSSTTTITQQQGVARKAPLAPHPPLGRPPRGGDLV